VAGHQAGRLEPHPTGVEPGPPEDLTTTGVALLQLLLGVGDVAGDSDVACSRGLCSLLLRKHPAGQPVPTPYPLPGIEVTLTGSACLVSRRVPPTGSNIVAVRCGPLLELRPMFHRRRLGNKSLVIRGYNRVLLVVFLARCLDRTLWWFVRCAHLALQFRQGLSPGPWRIFLSSPPARLSSP